MHSTLKPKQADDPHDVIVVAPDAVRVAPEVVQAVPGASQAALAEDELSSLLRAAARQFADPNPHVESAAVSAPPVPPVDTTFRASAVNDDLVAGRRTAGRRVLRAITALLLAVGIGAAAITWQTFGYAAKKAMVKWIPQFALTSSLPLDKLWRRLQPASPPVEADTTTAAAPAPEGASAQAPAEGAAESAAAPAADPAPSLQSMTHDLASMGQEVELLKASIAELKASQQQMARDLAKALEAKAPETNASTQPARAKPSAMAALPPRPAARSRRPAASPYSPTPTVLAPVPPRAAQPQAAQPYIPPPPQPYMSRQVESLPPAETRLPPEPGFGATPRPPMPVQ